MCQNDIKYTLKLKTSDTQNCKNEISDFRLTKKIAARFGVQGEISSYTNSHNLAPRVSSSYQINNSSMSSLTSGSFFNRLGKKNQNLITYTFTDSEQLFKDYSETAKPTYNSLHAVSVVYKQLIALEAVQLFGFTHFTKIFNKLTLGSFSSGVDTNSEHIFGYNNTEDTDNPNFYIETFQKLFNRKDFYTQCYSID
jgi:hypothetical protein